MSKQAVTGSFRKKPQYKIVFAPTEATKTPKKTSLSTTNKSDDLEAAINSITYSTQASDVIVPNSLKKSFTSNGTSADKIIFTPRTVQKKVIVLKKQEDVIQRTPLSSKSITKIVANYTPVKAATPAAGPLKKRKLGDFAMQSMQVKLKPNARNEPDPPKFVLCRICGSIVEGNAVALIDDKGVLTQAGNKVKSIVASEIIDSQVQPTSCCTACLFKVNVCFSLMIELKASDDVMKSTYDDLQEGDLVHPNSHVHVCSYCDMEVMGTKDFIKHIEKHLHDKALGNVEPAEGAKKKNVAVSDDDEENIMWNGRIFVEDDVEEDGTTHQPNDDGEHLCGICNRGFKYMFLLHLHRKGHKRPVSTPVRICLSCKQPRQNLTTWKNVCDECNAKELLDAAMPVKPIRTGNTLPDKRYFCDLCGSGFAFKYALRHHLQFHEKMESKLFVNRFCHICMQDLKTIHSLKAHLLTVHEITWKPGGNSYNCQKCFKPFDDLFKLRVHLRLYHDLFLPVGLRSPRMREFNCQVCQQKFQSENSARTHMRKIHNLTNNQMESLKTACEECGKMFSVKQNLLNHINAAHLKVKPISCDVCGERFVKHSSLIFHKLRHTGEKPFLCTLCQKTFRQRNDAVRHLARHVRDKEIEYEAACVLNTSTSKHIFKRLVYLKDSTIKGLQHIAKCATPPKRRKQSKRVETPVVFESAEPIEEETYQEIVMTDGAVLVEKNYENVNTDIQYVYEGEEDVVQPEFNYNVTVDEKGQQSLRSPGGGCYVLRENEAGEQYFVCIDSTDCE